MAKELFCYTKENEKVYIETVFESEVEKWVVEVSISSGKKVYTFPDKKSLHGSHVAEL